MTVPFTHRCLLLLSLVLPLMTGCAAFRPIHGVPARYVPDEFKTATRSGKRTIDLSLMRQRPCPVHLVDSGDLLAIYIEGILGRAEDQPPVYFPPTNDLPPSVGYPIPVRDDGMISLPLVGTLSVRGQTITQVEDTIRRAYTVDKQFLQVGRDRIFVALQRPRHYRVLVIRQEATSDVSVGAGGMLNLGALKRGTGKVVNLPVYKNDVLNALAESGGLPGLDAENAIYVIRSGSQPAVPVTPTHAQPNAWMPPAALPVTRLANPQIRGQSPSWTYDRAADYRSQVNTAGWSTPAGQPSVVQPVQYQAPYQPAMPVSAPLQPLPQAAPYAPPANPTPLPMMAPPSPPPGVMPTQPWTPQPDPMFPAPQPGEWAPLGQGWSAKDLGMTLDGRRVIRIPVRLGPGESVDITAEDVTLHDGDIVFIESRETEVFYTGGLLGGGQYTLPRDYDLDVLGAIAVAQGGTNGGGGGGSRGTQSMGGQSALNNDVSISASQVIILRPLCDGSQLTIQVDLYEALRNPNERIVIQPGDYILLQYTRPEAVLAFIERHLLEGALFGLAAAQLNSGGN
jgi:protein involved in polysaccharide export with SLBB domain